MLYDIGPPDQVVILQADAAYFQAINLTAFTTWDLVFMGRTKFFARMVVSLTNDCPMEHPKG